MLSIFSKSNEERRIVVEKDTINKQHKNRKRRQLQTNKYYNEIRESRKIQAEYCSMAEIETEKQKMPRAR